MTGEFPVNRYVWVLRNSKDWQINQIHHAGENYIPCMYGWPAWYDDLWICTFQVKKKSYEKLIFA
jgi:hypothetical protein